ncbi:uncharacterized protein HMPREF1541_05695 [Cyphellophora europaea CBS 101466]|uniref:Uncharacterized protein n=1 Tax=Cyphellophora europaea (strain CBS 101466) TaxID=1220924 RepID=W2RSI6_CYPE1|nr:uncharacterized protein HMPREF1541_05695 [Cyphellophora europaea CBS 101466]ETN39471.1 hypothetical protein HMPREF1541_05695 [Cyphellophora europaea CBS 101466]
MSTPKIEIYTGPWVDWSKGALLGSTITLSRGTAPIFTAFLAFFITIVGACLWRSICFTIHQISASPKPKDGMHHQHQLILRNTSSPTEATRAFFESAFFWRNLALTASSILSSLVAQSSGSHRLITSNDCGYFAYDNSSSLEVRTKAMTSKDLNDTVLASSYARTCYEGNDKLNKLQCSSYVKPALKWTAPKNASCPFDHSMCKDGLVYQLDTGIIESHEDLGINMPSSGRIGFRKVTTCAPIVQDGFVSNQTSEGTDGLGLEGDNVRQYHYGGIAAVGLDNTTYWYNTHAFVGGWGYELESITASPGSVGWAPIPELARSDADVTLIFLAANAIKYYEANSDPFYSSNFEANAGTLLGSDVRYYIADEFVSVMGCTDQYQYCHPSSRSGPDKCTPLADYATAWASIYDDKLSFNDVQQLVASRIGLNSRGFSIHHGIGGRGASALRAQDYVSDRNQLQIRPDQWQVEINSWFDVGLAKLQRAMVQYATGPGFTPEGTFVQKPQPDEIISRAMCGSQMVRVTDGTTSFSVLGISIIFAVGTLIILTYLVLETLVSSVQRKFHWGDYRRVRWGMDDKLQVQRMAFEGAGMGGEWKNLSGMVPVTAKAEEFAGLEHVDPEKPRLGGQWNQSTKATRSSISSLGEVHHHGLAKPVQMAAMPVYDRLSQQAVDYLSSVYQPLPAHA